MATGNEKNFELRLGKTGLIIVIAGMTALLCAVFLFGVDVGENIDVYPDKIASFPQRVLALVWRPAKVKISQNDQNNKIGVKSTDPAGAGENIDLTFYNALTSKKGLSKEEMSLETQPAAPQTKSDEEMQKGKFVIESQKPPEKTIEDIIDANKSSEEKPPDVKKDSSDNASQKHKFIVQAGSMKEKSKADEMNKKITSIGFKSEIIKANVNGKGIMFRVVVSGFDEKAKAEQAARKIEKKTGSNCIVKKAGS
jgi:cell division septation protein DedD